MSISTASSQAAAKNPALASAVNQQNIKSALLYSAQSGDAQDAAQLGALYNQTTAQQMLIDSAPHPYLGNYVDLQA